MKYFWLSPMLGILEITISLVSIKKSCYQCHLPYTHPGQFTGGLYLKLLWTYDIFIICLHVTDTCLEVIIVMFYFCHSKNPLDVMKNIFDSIHIYFWKKLSLLTNRNKRVIRKVNLYFFDAMKSGHIFPSKVLSFSIWSKIPF